MNSNRVSLCNIGAAALVILIPLTGTAQQPPICPAVEPTPVSNIHVNCRESQALDPNASPDADHEDGEPFLSESFRRPDAGHVNKPEFTVLFTVNATGNVGEVSLRRLRTNRMIVSYLMNNNLVYRRDMQQGTDKKPPKIASRFTRTYTNLSPVDLGALETALLNPGVSEQMIECVGGSLAVLAPGDPVPPESCQEAEKTLKAFIDVSDTSLNGLGAVTSEHFKIDAWINACIVKCNCRCCLHPASGCFCK